MDEMLDYNILAMNLLDDLIELTGVDDMIERLLNKGYSKEDLMELGFDENDIDRIENEIEEYIKHMRELNAYYDELERRERMLDNDLDRISELTNK